MSKIKPDCRNEERVKKKIEETQKLAPVFYSFPEPQV